MCCVCVGPPARARGPRRSIPHMNNGLKKTDSINIKSDNKMTGNYRFRYQVRRKNVQME